MRQRTQQQYSHDTLWILLWVAVLNGYCCESWHCMGTAVSHCELWVQLSHNSLWILLWHDTVWVLLWVTVHYGYIWVMTLYGGWCESVQFMGTALSHDAVWALLWVRSLWVLLWVIRINLLIVEYIRNLQSDVKCEPWSRARTCKRSLLLSDSCHWSLSVTSVARMGSQPSELCWYSEQAYGRWL